MGLVLYRWLALALLVHSAMAVGYDREKHEKFIGQDSIATYKRMINKPLDSPCTLAHSVLISVRIILF